MESINKGLTPQQLCDEYSPSIPENFPIEKIPKNICGKELLILLKCTRALSDRDICQNYYEDFLTCKKERDLKLFNEIKEWEIGHFNSFSLQNKNFYILGMGKKLERLENEYQKIPTTFVYGNKAWRYKSDIDQTQWRLQYLKPYLNKQVQTQNSDEKKV